MDGEAAVNAMEGNESVERMLSTGDVVFSADGADVSSVETDMTLDEISDNPGNINVDSPPALDDGTTTEN